METKLTHTIFKLPVQWYSTVESVQCSPGNCASHDSDQGMIKLDFFAEIRILEILDRVPLTRVENRNLMAILSFQGDTLEHLVLGQQFLLMFR